MAKADKPDTSTESKENPSSEITEDVVDAEIIEEVSAEDADVESDDDVEQGDVDLSDTDTAVEEDADSAEAAETDDAVDSDEDTPTEDPAELSEPAPQEAEVQSEATPAPVKKVGFFPVVLGGVIAAGLGFGASQYVGPLFAQKDEAFLTLEATVAAQSAQIETLLAAQEQTEATASGAQSSVSAFEAQVTDFAASVNDVNGRFDDTSQALATLDGRLTALEKNPITQNLPSSAIAAYERELEDLKALVTAQRAEAESMEENAKLSAQEALARAALTRVQSALDSGAAYRVALKDFSTATGASIPDGLNALADEGVPTLAVLQDDFPAAARAALAASRVELSQDEGRLSGFLKAQLGARSVTPQDGTDTDAVLSRAEDTLRRGDVAGALAEVATLEETAAAEMAAWVSLAQSRQAAFLAAETLSQSFKAN